MLLPSVMIIDDSETDRYLLKRLLQRGKIAGHIFEAKDGLEAIELLTGDGKLKSEFPDKFPPLLLFLDVNMPRMDGFSFLEEFAKLRKEHDLGSVVLLMISSSEREEEKQRALKYQFVKGFLTKMPRTADGLRDEITRALPLEE